MKIITMIKIREKYNKGKEYKQKVVDKVHIVFYLGQQYGFLIQRKQRRKEDKILIHKHKYIQREIKVEEVEE